MSQGRPRHRRRNHVAPTSRSSLHRACSCPTSAVKNEAIIDRTMTPSYSTGCSARVENSTPDSSFAGTMDMVRHLSGITVEQADHRHRRDEGRPAREGHAEAHETSRARALPHRKRRAGAPETSSPHRRKGIIQVDVVNIICPSCGKRRLSSRCQECSEATIRFLSCPRCGQILKEAGSCPNCKSRRDHALELRIRSQVRRRRRCTGRSPVWARNRSKGCAAFRASRSSARS